MKLTLRQVAAIGLGHRPSHDLQGSKLQQLLASNESLHNTLNWTHLWHRQSSKLMFCAPGEAWFCS